MSTELLTTKMTFRGLSDEDEDEQTLADREDLETEELEDGEDDDEVAEETEVLPPSGDGDSE